MTGAMTMDHERGALAPGRTREQDRLGALLVRDGSITPQQLRDALAVHRRTGERLGRVLMTAGWVRRQDLHRALAELWHCRFIDLRETPPDPEVARRVPLEVMLAEGWVAVLRPGRHGRRGHL